MNDYNDDALTPLQKRVLLHGDTEPPFSGIYVDKWDPGIYHCARCGARLFSSQRKFDNGCGWPSFDKPVTPEAIHLQVDTSHGMTRTETRCDSCGAHLGHVFLDGPKELPGGAEGTGMRFCINSVALDFHETTDTKRDME